MKSVAVLQARTSSSRLPGKVILPIGERPMAILAALRAANTGRPVVLATSVEPSDDVLEHFARSYSVTCYRGSLKSPLERIVGSLEDYPDDTVVFRLTGDNVFPDGQLLDELQDEFVEAGLSYLCCNGAASGVPYGLSVEVLWLRDLRWALSVAVDGFDHEHVTPLIRRRYGERYFDRYVSLGWGVARCTVDCLDDYLLVQKVFADVADPIAVGWKELCNRLLQAPGSPAIKQPVTKLVLGTAQLGMQYGINNNSGVPNVDLAKQIVRTAIRNGVECIDTARAYGFSETVVGKSLSEGWQGRAKIITKLAPLDELNEGFSGRSVELAVRASIFESCQKLGAERLDVLMLHRASHINQWNGRVWGELRKLVDEDIIGSLGVSVQTPDELKNIIAVQQVSYVQMPFNLLDWRWDPLEPLIGKVKADRDMVFHVRSSLLQGLLVSEDVDLWRRAHVEIPGAVIQALKGMVQRLSRDSIADLCLAYVRGLSWVDGICVGMETLEQLQNNVALFQRSPLQFAEIQQVRETRPVLGELTLNPVNWRRGTHEYT